jgi:transcription elongation GreA/GreB family factor
MYDIVIVGGGAAGITAAIYALRAGMNIVLLEKMGVGGQIILTEAVENYPGFSFISGPELMDKFEKHAKKFGLEIIYEEAKRIEFDEQLHRVVTDENTFETRSVIVGMGSVPKKLNVPGEEKLIGRGVSFCAVCDGPFFKDREVAVIGGGDAAVKEAIYLTKEGYDLMRQELDNVEKTLYEEIPEKLKASKMNGGDLRENKEYMYLQSQQQYYEREVRRLTSILESAEVLPEEDISKDEIGIGSRFILQDLTIQESGTFTLVSAPEVDLEKGKISVASPVGQLLLGKKEGDRVKAQLPWGASEFRVIAINQ